MTRPARHDLVWLDPARLDALALDPAHRGEVARWLAAGWPLVATRRPPGLAAQVACLGLPLPPSRGRTRIALRAPADAVVGVEKALRLVEALPSAPPDRRGALAALHDQARRLGLTLRVHGSLAWQHLTGQPYLTEGSDLDLLLTVTDRAQLTAALGLLQRWERRTGLTADAEIGLPAGGVAWREVWSGAARLLVKGEDFVALRPRAELLAPLDAEGAGAKGAA